MTGGLRNPLGAMALYLGNTLYRIHGTNDVASIGHAQSSGCFRMLNSGVLHLASIANVGTQVTVVKSLTSTPSVSAGDKTPEAAPPKPHRNEISTPPAELRATASQPDNKDRDYADMRARLGTLTRGEQAR
jgi:hypothetical protein